MSNPPSGPASDDQPGPGWWKASDGQWYPPQPPAGSVPRQKSGFLKGALIVVGAFVLFIAFLVLSIAFLGSPAEVGG